MLFFLKILISTKTVERTFASTLKIKLTTFRADDVGKQHENLSTVELIDTLGHT